MQRQYGPVPFYQTTAAQYPHFNFADFSGEPLVDAATMGFKWGRYEARSPFHAGPIRGFMIVAPFWAILLLVGVPTLLLLRWYVVLARRSGPGLCPSCGYDLRATPGRCPECGTVPAKAGP